MEKYLRFLFIFTVILLISTLAVAYPTGKEILKKIDKNFAFTNQVSHSTMIIETRRGTRTLSAKSYALGRNKTFTEYLSPPRDKGTKMLKIDDDLWTYTPMADRIIKIAGHMLRQSVMGSDLSYEDMMETDKLTEYYDATVTGQETINHRPCWILTLTATQKKVAYHSRKIWVDQKRYLALREERFAKSGKLLKTTEIQSVMKLQNRWYPKKMVFKDALKKGNGTTFILDKIEFDVHIPKHLFSKASLRR